VRGERAGIRGKWRFKNGEGMRIVTGTDDSNQVSSDDKASDDALFVMMLRAFRRSGGLAREAEVIDRSQACNSPGWRVDCLTGAIICFEWEQRFWLPWFQFDPADMSLRPGPARVIAELAPVFDGWGIATWFAQPNLWLANARPVDLIDECLASVLGAARADRFIAAG
jgi:hypothetical protein